MGVHQHRSDFVAGEFPADRSEAVENGFVFALFGHVYIPIEAWRRASGRTVWRNGEGWKLWDVQISAQNEWRNWMTLLDAGDEFKSNVHASPIERAFLSIIG